MILFILFYILCLVIAVEVIFKPRRDILSNGDKIIWYNSEGRFGKDRDYFIYKRYGRN